MFVGSLSFSKPFRETDDETPETPQTGLKPFVFGESRSEQSHNFLITMNYIISNLYDLFVICFPIILRTFIFLRIVVSVAGWVVRFLWHKKDKFDLLFVLRFSRIAKKPDELFFFDCLQERRVRFSSMIKCCEYRLYEEERLDKSRRLWYIAEDVKFYKEHGYNIIDEEECDNEHDHQHDDEHDHEREDEHEDEHEDKHDNERDDEHDNEHGNVPDDVHNDEHDDKRDDDRVPDDVVEPVRRRSPRLSAKKPPGFSYNEMALQRAMWKAAAQSQ